MILQALHQLSSRLPERRILSWEFFFNRFDALYLEAQIALEKYGDIAFPRGNALTVMYLYSDKWVIWSTVIRPVWQVINTKKLAKSKIVKSKDLI